MNRVNLYSDLLNSTLFWKTSDRTVRTLATLLSLTGKVFLKTEGYLVN